MESSGKTADFSSGFSQEFIKKFTQFTLPDCDRRAFIRQYLAENGIQTTEIPIAGKKHIFVNQSASAYSPLFRLKTVIAHYDRASGTPGANDNSSSVFALMDFAIRLKNYKGIHNIRIFFTDGEELDENPEISSSGEESPGCKVNGQSNKQTKNQSGSQIFSRMGAFGLAALFKKAGITNDDVYVFDCTGRGTIPILGETILPPGVPAKFYAQYKALEDRAKGIIRSASHYFMTLPVPCSDNAGFLVCRIPTVIITMLPDEEATSYARNLLLNKELKDFVTHRKTSTSSKNGSGKTFSQTEAQLKDLLPQTWKLFHTQNDSLQSLTFQSFAITARILDNLAASKTML